MPLLSWNIFGGFWKVEISTSCEILFTFLLVLDSSICLVWKSQVATCFLRIFEEKIVAFNHLLPKQDFRICARILIKFVRLLSWNIFWKLQLAFCISFRVPNVWKSKYHNETTSFRAEVADLYKNWHKVEFLSNFYVYYVEISSEDPEKLQK